MDNGNFVELSRFSCDSCGYDDGPTAVYHNRGVPVLAQCQRCDPRAWEAAGERARDQWMSGELPNGCSPVSP
jgi:hypothetical protein